MSGRGVGTLTPPEDAGDGAAPLGGPPAAPMPVILNVTEEKDRFLVTDASGTYPILKDGLKPDTIAYLEGMTDAGKKQVGDGSMEWRSPQGVVVDRDLTPEEKARVDARVAPVDQTQGMPLFQPQVPVVPPAPPPAVPAPVIIPGGPPPVPLHSFASGGEVDAGFPSPFVPLDFMGAPDAGAPMPGPGAPVDAFGVPVQMPVVATGGEAALPEGHWMRRIGSGVKGLWDSFNADPNQAAQAAEHAAAQKAIAGPPSSGPGSQTHPPGGLALSEAPPTQAAPARAPSYGGTGQVAEFNRGIEEQRAALQAQADVEGAKAQAALESQVAYTAKLQAAQADYEEQRALVQRRADDLFMSIQNGKVDPNRLWANADLGQRVSAGIGILLSGIGVGLAGGPNLALAQIDRTIERDIAAQKDTLDRQQSLLSFYLQQGRDMMTAHQLVKADLKDALAAQLGVVSAQFGGAEASARAQMAMGQLRSSAAGERQQIMARGFAMQQQRLAQEMEIERSRVLSALLSTPRTPAGGIPAPGQVLEMLPKELRERAVKLPDGSFGFAVDQKRAQDYTKATQTTTELQRTIGRYNELLKTGSPITPTVLGGDRAAAQALRTDLLLKMKDLYGLGALQAYELEQMEKLIPDITAIFTSDQTLQQSIDTLNRSIHDKVASNLQTMIAR